MYVRDFLFANIHNYTSLVIFYVHMNDGSIVQCSADDDMTWEAGLASSYNTIDAYNSYGVIQCGGRYVMKGGSYGAPDSSYTYPGDIIISSEHYYVSGPVEID